MTVQVHLHSDRESYLAVVLTPDAPEACAVWYAHKSPAEAMQLLAAIEKIAEKMRRDLFPETPQSNLGEAAAPLGGWD